MKRHRHEKPDYPREKGWESVSHGLDWNLCHCSIQFSHSVVSYTLWSHGLQHGRLPCPSPIPTAWVSDAIKPSHPLSSPSPPAFNFSQHQGLFKWVSSLHQVAKVLRVSASASVLPMNIQDWFLLGWLDLLAVQGMLKNVSNTTVPKHQFLWL